MRILHLHLSREFAGSETYAASLARLQAGAGHTAAVLLRQSEALPRWRHELEGVAVLILPRWAVGFLGAWVAHQYAKGFAPDVFHSHLGRAHGLGQWLGRRHKVPHVGTVHLRYKPKEHAGCDALIAIAKWQLAEMPPAVLAKAHVVWNWLPRPTVKLKKAKPQGPFVFGSVGRLHPQKGFDTLITAFKEAFPKQDDVRLELVGEGAMRAELEALIGADSRITLQGYQADPAPFYERWHAYVSASRHEPFGLTLLEAMQHSLPLVCTRTEGPREFLADQPVTWAEKGNVSSLAAALRACHNIGSQSVAYDLAPFDPECAAAQIEEIYKELTP